MCVAPIAPVHARALCGSLAPLAVLCLIAKSGLHRLQFWGLNLGSSDVTTALWDMAVIGAM